MQKAMIKLRLNLLDAFLRPEAPDMRSYFCAGNLVLVDLTDPFLDGEHSIITPIHMLLGTSLFRLYSGLTAAVLFDIVLGLFMQWRSVNGKIVGTSYRMYSLRIILICVVVLDEAHKYLINSDTARLTQSISSIIRLQRHLATRIIIVTQVGHHRPIMTRLPLTACPGAYGHPTHHA
jgi:hypothetical protein